MEKEVIFYKPNQLITMDRSKFNRIQLEGINLMLKRAQDKLLFNGRLFRKEIKAIEKQNPLTELEMLDYKYKVSIHDIMDISERNLDSKQLSRVRKYLLDLKSLAIETLDKKSCTITSLFQEISYNFTTCNIEYVLSNSITKSFYNNTTVIGQLESEDKEKTFYTPICLKYGKEFKSEYTYNLLEHVLRFSKFANGIGYKSTFSMDDFKSLLGVKYKITDDDVRVYSYQKPSDFKLKVLDIVVNEMKENGILIDINILGRGKYAQEIELIINKGTIIPDFLEKGYEHEKNIERIEIEKEIKGGIEELRLIMNSKIKDESLKYKIDIFINDTDYEKYVKIMNNINLDIVDKEQFELGYRYIVGDDK
jgi:hypothetical protein